MMNIIEVQCPHCGARGQIMMPPVGAIIIGPCPQCNELVVVFCGHVLPLEKEIMENSPVEERRDHLLEVLTEFLRERITKLMTEEEDEPSDYDGDSDSDDSDSNVAEPPPEETSQPVAEKPEPEKARKKPISDSELDQFKSIDLKLLDNPAYFKSVFGGNQK